MRDRDTDSLPRPVGSLNGLQMGKSVRKINKITGRLVAA